MTLLKVLTLLVLSIFFESSVYAETCVPMWDATPTDQNICSVPTESGEDCVFPFNYYRSKMYRCYLWQSNYAMCNTTKYGWSRCIVPNDAVVSSVGENDNEYWTSFGTNGGSKLSIKGYRFGSLFSTKQEEDDKSNKVYLINDYSSYECKIISGLTKSTQIFCTMPRLPQGNYNLQIITNGFTIPRYQYSYYPNIYINDYYTPQIYNIQPFSNIPGSFVSISGDFKTQCILQDNSLNYDNSSCAVISNAKIKRIYFGAQLCELFDSYTNELYDQVTRNSLKCKLSKSEIGYFNASILVSGIYGKSSINKDIFYVSPNDDLFNYHTYAQINSVSQNMGGKLGGTKIKINGLYFYHDEENVPARIQIDDWPCKIVNFSQENLPDTSIDCLSPPAPNATKTEYFGNRGINITIDQVYTPFNSLSTAKPSSNAKYAITNQTAFISNQTNDTTIWYTGYLSPKIDSLYELEMITNAEAVLYLSTDFSSANQKLIASTLNNNKSRIQLKANNNYYMQMIASKKSGFFSFVLSAKMFNTSLTEQVTSNVRSELQKIEISSKIDYETYNIDYSGLSPTIGVSEVQTIKLSGKLGIGFILSFEGVTTTLISYGASASEIQYFLNDLPNLSPNLVNVSEVTTSDKTSKTYTIQFSDSLGDVENIKEVNGKVSFTVTETTKGKTSGKLVQAVIGNRKTKLFDIKNLTDARKAIFSVSTTSCPYSILNGPDITDSNDFEDISIYNYYYGYYSNNSYLNYLSLDSFCGRYSSKMSYMTQFNKKNENFRYVCLAYKSNIRIYYVNLWSSYNWKNYYFEYNFIYDNQWHYDCLDLYQLTKFDYNVSSSANYIYFGIDYNMYSSSRYTLIDAITFRNSTPNSYKDDLLLTTRRQYPGVKIIEDSFSVSNSLANNAYNVSFLLENCGTMNPMNLSQNINGLKLTRTKSANGAVTGYYSLKYNNILIKDIPANSSETQLNLLLKKYEELESINVTRYKNCYGYAWNLKWLVGGKKPLFQINTTSLNGNNVNINTTELSEGYALFNPIRDDMLRTYHKKPQIIVSINNVMSKCIGSCDFEWQTSLTPQVISINNSNQNSIVINGNGFDDNIEKNIVKLGDVECKVTKVTNTSLSCSPGNNSFGTYNFSVNIIDKGSAEMKDNKNVTFLLSSTSISPLSSGTGGGVLLNVSGSGFNKETLVTIDGLNCPVSFASYSLIICKVPPNPTNTDKQCDVVVKQKNFVSTVPQKFTYNYSQTPIVNSINPIKLSVLGGELVKITGTNLPLNPINVQIGNSNVKVINSTNNELVIQTVSLEPGLYDLIIAAGDIGIAMSNIKIEYQLYVSSFTPNIGSIRGGTIVTVYGEGFSSNCGLNQVNFGPQRCSVLNCSSTWIKCQTSTAFLTHQIDNSGSDPYYGPGYGWSKAYLEISKGDSVRWSWKPPNGISQVKFKVAQTPSGDSFSENGFTSGEASKLGSFEYQFNQAGTYYYWSGLVESTGQISFRGVIVVLDSSDKTLDLNVTLNGYVAQKCSFPFVYNSNSYTTCTNVGFGYNWCSPVSNYNEQILKCDPINQAPSDSCQNSNLNSCNVVVPSSKYTMLFTKCQDNLAKILNISSYVTSFDSEITITGTGFSSNSCENQILIGGIILCPLTYSSATKLTCKLSSSNASNLESYVDYKVDVLVKNIGYATYDNNILIKFSSTINSITPNIGSIAGGAQMNISGYGFKARTTYVQLGDFYYFYSNDQYNTLITFNYIIINTLPLDEGNYTIKVYVNDLPITCAVSTLCQFTTSKSITPEIDSISPTVVNDSSLITINGKNFGIDITNLNINIGSEICQVQTATDTQLTCSLNGLNLGDQSVNLNLKDVGNSISSSSITVNGQATIKDITPNTGSINGGTLLTIRGNGFDNSTQVYIGQSYECVKVSVLINVLTCLTKALTYSSSNLAFTIKTNDVIYATTGFDFSYTTTNVPQIDLLTPLNATTGTLTITGSNFGANSSNVKVWIDKVLCDVSTISNTQIECNLAQKSAGTYQVFVQLDNIGYSNMDKKFTYDVLIDYLSSSEGSVGGGLVLKISGKGFSSNSSVTICFKPCSIIQATYDTISCLVPKSASLNSDTNCDLIVTENLKTATSKFKYSLAVSPKLSSVSPLRGGTGGGTLITISGTNFPNDKTQVNVTIADIECTVSSISSTQIQCYTGGYTNSSIKALVQVFVINKGQALNDGSVNFEYIDLWSSEWTWGGLPPPGEGELAVIGPGQTIYFDAESTPKLKGLIIQAGALIFDDNQDVSLNVEYIIITDRGRLQIGTKEMPFQHKAVITMYGGVRSIELPIFGSKVLALRNGTLDMHGLPVGVTWTHLDETVEAGSNTIKLKEPVDSWPLNGEIIITTTNNKFSVGQTEKRIIKSKSLDNMQLTLDKPLSFKHYGEKRTIGNSTKTVDIYLRAEVGLLTRNVVFQGYSDPSWAPLLSAPACPKGFDPGEYAVQTCFLGRYGPELGTDQFGAIITANAGLDSLQYGVEPVIIRLSNVELFHVGQAFRLGRYPISFVSNGDSRSSYITECSLHESFNRAINLRETSFIKIERNVFYDVMGMTLSLELGAETENSFQYNLIAFVKPSSSSLNIENTPAAFWITNPKNYVAHNSVAGCSHFGYWYNLAESVTSNFYYTNPKYTPLGKFLNNTVHSSGRYGLWIYPGYFPNQYGYSDNWGYYSPSVAVFDGLISYSNDKGAEFLESNYIQFRNFIIWDQYSIGIETKTLLRNQEQNANTKAYFYDEAKGALVADTIVIGSLNPSNSITKSGIVVAWDRGELFSNISFYNFPDSNSHAIRATEIIGRCVYGCGGWTNQFKGLFFDNVKYRTMHRWGWDFVALDLDGTLSDVSGGGTIVHNDQISSNKPDCNQTDGFLNGVVCSNKNNWVRMTYSYSYSYYYYPYWFYIYSTQITDMRNSTAYSPYLIQRLTQQGVMFALEVNQEYTLVHYSNYSGIDEIAYSGYIYGLKPNEYIIIKHPVFGQKPSSVSTISYSPSSESLSPLSFSSNQNGDWYWNNETNTLSYIILNKGNSPFIDYNINFQASCSKPCVLKPTTTPLATTKPIYFITDNNNQTVTVTTRANNYNQYEALTEPYYSRPSNVFYWSNISTWQAIAQPGWGGYGIYNNTFPKDGDNVLIPSRTYVVVDCVLPKLKRLQINGALEFANGIDHYLEVELIIINGGHLIIGWENDPILSNVVVNFTGSFQSAEYSLMKNKGIGVFGFLNIHGKPTSVAWTKISETVLAGTNTVKLAEPIDWNTNDEIVISTTNADPTQSEIVKIASISDDKLILTLVNSTKFNHYYYKETLNSGEQYEVIARVGLLTHNVILTSGSYSQNDYQNNYGFNLVVTSNSFFADSFTFQSFARISNVQLNRIGQYIGGNNYYGGVTFTSLVTNSATRSSYVKSSSLVKGLNYGISVLSSSSSVLIEKNIIFDIGYPITSYSNSYVKHNMLVSSFGTTISAIYSQLEDNFFSGVFLDYLGESCSSVNLIKDNVLYAAGITIRRSGSGCIRISNFVVVGSPTTAIHYIGEAETIIESNVLISNQIGTFVYIYAPPSTQHIAGTKKSIIRNSLIVGRPPIYNCSTDDYKFSILNGAGPNYDSKIGIIWSQFLDSYDFLKAPMFSITSYNQIAGLTTVDSVTFAYFDKNCKGTGNDSVIATNSLNDDGQHPVTFQNIRLQNVSDSSKVWIHRPNLNTINPSQCVDMDCDGLKKNLLTDLDGSFLGTPGSVISQSEWQWGSQERGLGDFRIPKELLAAPNSSFIDPKLIYKYPGIVRDENSCQYKSDWQAYECHGIDHKMLIIESMDDDSEKRRLSPVAILADNKYLDLINGPQNHDICYGYGCQKRISTFMAIIAANKSFDIYVTSSQPNQLRFRVLNADANFKARLSMYYFTSQRIDLYLNDAFINATNSITINGKMTLADPNSNLASYMPSYANKSGTNFYYKLDSRIYFTIDGTSVIDLKIAPVLYVKFGVPAITPQEFFKPETVVGNFAALLGVEPSKIRRVNIIRASSSSGKKKRDTDELIFIELVMFDDPPTSLENKNDSKQIETQMTSLSNKISNQFLTGQIQKKAETVLNVTISSMSVKPPIVEPSKVTNNTQEIVLVKVARIEVVKNADQCRELMPCTVQPVIKVIDNQNKLVKNLNWVVQVKLNATSNQNIKLLYQTEAIVVDGYANFTNLGFSLSTNNIILDYSFKLPDGIDETYFDPLNILGDPVSTTKSQFECVNLDKTLKFTENEYFNLTFKIIESMSKIDLPNIAWQNYNWQARIQMYSFGNYRAKGSLVHNSSSITIFPDSGYTLFSNVSIDKVGMYLLSIKLYSLGKEFSSQCYSNLITVSRPVTTSLNITNQTQPNYKLKFSGDFYKLTEFDKIEIKSNIYNYVSDFNISVYNIDLYAGSVIAVFSSTDTNSNLIQQLIQNGINVSSLVVFQSADINGYTISCSKCASIQDENKSNQTGAIVGGVIGGLALIVIVIFGYLIYKEWIKTDKRTKVSISTHDELPSANEMTNQMINMNYQSNLDDNFQLKKNSENFI